MLNIITKNIQVTEDCKYFPRRPHVGQPWCRQSVKSVTEIMGFNYENHNKAIYICGIMQCFLTLQQLVDTATAGL